MIIKVECLYWMLILMKKDLFGLTYNANTETEQINTIHKLVKLLGVFCLDLDKKIILACDLNLLFDRGLEALGRKPALKKNQLQNLCKYLKKTILMIFGESATQL